jgi:3-oxoacyl-[acyl-carrier protein] reductase
VPDDEDFWKIQKEDLGQIVVQLISMHPRSLPSKIELRPTRPGGVGK